MREACLWQGKGEETMQQWNGFKAGDWQNEINVRDFIQRNYTPYEGDESFLAWPTARTSGLVEKLNARLNAIEK